MVKRAHGGRVRVVGKVAVGWGLRRCAYLYQRQTREVTQKPHTDFTVLVHQTPFAMAWRSLA